MNYFKDTTLIQISEPTVITLGKFDGLHSGHQYLINHLQKEKEEHHFKSVVFTFVKPPMEEIAQTKTKVLSTMEEKEYIFQSANIDYLIEYPFTNEVRCQDAESFVHDLVKSLNVKAMIVGDDFRFGYQRQGDYKLLQRLSEPLGYTVTVVKKKQYHGEDISSTLIRSLITEGNLALANQLLGYTYFVQEKVVTGNKIGRTLGIPTINQIPAEEKLLPPFGVYAVKVCLPEGAYYGIANIGVKPTVGKNNPIGVETNIFDYEGDLYGKLVRVYFFKQIRPEMKFQSLEQMKQQICQDSQKVREMISLSII